MDLSEKSCVFCGNRETRIFSVRGKGYYRCAECGGIFADSSTRLSSEAERKRYELHRNTLADEGYRTYLENCITAISDFPGLNASGNPLSVLDWGSGPEPALVCLLRRRGYAACGYDPFFAPEQPCSPESVDLVTCIEVAEHFAAPREDFINAARFLVSGGFFAVRTGFLPEDENIEAFFGSWWYREDPTHISFYTEKALVAATESANLAFLGYAAKNIALLRKHS